MHLTSRSRIGDNPNPSIPGISTATSGESSSYSTNHGSHDRATLLSSSSSSPPAKSGKSHPSKRYPRGNGDVTFLSLLLRRAQYHWAVASFVTKVFYTVLALYLAQAVVLATWDFLFQRMGEIDDTVAAASSSSVEISFAVAINTFKRPDRLRKAVRHYAEICGRQAGISQVFVIWAEQNAPVVPEASSFFDQDDDSSSLLRGREKSLGGQTDNTNRADVYVLQKDKDSLNSRFEPIAALQSTAVFMVDDDVRVSCSSLAHGFRAWNSHPDSMVGFYPRLASAPLLAPQPSDHSRSTTTTTELVYHTWPIVYWRHSFNFILTKASFLHSKYLELYSGTRFPQEIRDHVDQHKNCEDVAMSMLVANYTKYMSSSSSSSSSSATTASGGTPAPPIYVEGHVSDGGLFGGISTGGGHFSTRSDCLTHLSAILEAQGWGSPLAYQVPLRDYSWLKHAPGFWWQYRPSNLFEWLSFGNTLA
jgi:hypothetical protein